MWEFSSATSSELEDDGDPVKQETEPYDLDSEDAYGDDYDYGDMMKIKLEVDHEGIKVREEAMD